MDTSSPKYRLSPDNGLWDQQLARLLMRPFRNTCLHPNHVTTGTLILGLASSLLFMLYGTTWADLASLLFMLAVFSDHMDGELARMSNRISRFGYYYDYMVGGFNYALIFISIGIGLWQEEAETLWLVLGLMAGLSNPLILYLRMTMEHHLGKQLTQHPGRFGFNVEDFIYLMGPLTWVFGIQYFFLPYAVGTIFYLLWTLKEFFQFQLRRAPANQRKSRTPVSAIAAILGLSCVFLLGVLLAPARPTPAAPPAYLIWPEPRKLGTFTLSDSTGKAFGIDQFTNRWSFLFFGYTHCPDICPMTLALMKQVYPKLVEAHPQLDIRMVFVTLDPERDDADTMNRYINHFDTQFIGLRGELQQVHTFARQLGVPFAYVAGANAEQYDVDHPASLFLIDDEARLVSLFHPPHRMSDMQSKFSEIVGFLQQQR